jgi:flap endonuclease-1
MGIKKFNELVTPQILELSQLKGKVVAVDAMSEIWKRSVGVKKLTDSQGKPTQHIVGLLRAIIMYQKAGLRQIWVFDSDSKTDEHRKYKNKELALRKAKRKQAQKVLDDLKDEEKALEELKKQYADYPDILATLDSTAVFDETKKIKMEKRAFVVKAEQIQDAQMILDGLGIPWLVAPPTYEAEHVAANLTQLGIADYVLTPDADAIIYGARHMIKKGSTNSSFVHYDREAILKQLQTDTLGLIQIALCLGSDANPGGIKGIGPKRVLGKYRTIDWTPYSDIIQMFLRVVPSKQIKLNKPSGDRQKLLGWLESRNFNKGYWSKVLGL